MLALTLNCAAYAVLQHCAETVIRLKAVCSITIYLPQLRTINIHNSIEH
jgi:hypothetical protein